jgi:lysophospholipase L1-like esterase
MEKDAIAKHSFLKPVALAFGYVADRPVSFWLNAAATAVWLYLVWPLFDPVFFNSIYAVYLTILTLPALGYAYLALVGGRRINTGLLVTCVCIFAIGEICLRLRTPAPENRWAAPIVTGGRHLHPYYMFTGVPDSSGQVVPQQGGANAPDNIYRLNSLGFRIERPFIKSKPVGELRIFVLGGSTVFQGAPLAKTIPGQIESELLDRGFSRARVYNFGIVSAVSGQELALLTHLLVDYAPDVVISYGGGNDMHSPYQYDPRPGFPFDFVTLQIGTQALAGGLDLRTALANQMFRSRMISLIFAPRVQEIRLPLSALRTAVGYRTPEWENAIIDAYTDNLHRMCRLSRAFNFRFYAVLQPMIFQKSPLSETEMNLKFGDTNFASYMRRQHNQAVLAFHRLQADDGREGSCRFVDLSQIFANDPRSLFWDFIHVNNDGNATIASAIATDLANSLLPHRTH